MYCVKLDYFINAKYERPEIFVTEKQCPGLLFRELTKGIAHISHFKTHTSRFKAKDV